MNPLFLRRVYHEGIRSQMLSQPSFSHKGCQVADATAIAPFIVVPGKYLGHFALHDNSRKGIDDRRSWVPTKIARNEWLITITENPIKWAIGRRLERTIQGFRRGGFLEVDDKIDNRDGGRRHAQ